MCNAFNLLVPSQRDPPSVIKEIINDVPDSVDYVGMVKIVLIEYVFKQDVRRSSMGSPGGGAGAAIAITAK
jgi:hypothetical protein